jgi:uncharacterized protein YxjI
MKPQLAVEQAITAFVNKYKIFRINKTGKKDQLQAFVQQKRFSLKEKILFYSDESKNNLLFTCRAEKVVDIHGKYIVEDARGNIIGVFKKDFGKSLVSSTWHILDSTNQPILTISETNSVIAVLRRFIGFVPIIGDALDIILIFIKYHFSFKKPGGMVVGIYKKTTLFRDNYALIMEDSEYRNFDWRVLAALSVALDALQSR